MNIDLEKFRGIHPGIILERELKKRSLRKRPFALLIGEHPQTLQAIIKGKRRLNVSLALKIEEKLDLEEGTLAILQTLFDIKEEKRRTNFKAPNLSIIRKSLFWGTDINNIDWDKHSHAVIRRVFERGNESEKQELINLYAFQKINLALTSLTNKPYLIYKNNALL